MRGGRGARGTCADSAEKRVAEYAASLSLTATDAPTLDPAHHYLGTPPGDHRICHHP